MINPKHINIWFNGGGGRSFRYPIAEGKFTNLYYDNTATYKDKVLYLQYNVNVDQSISLYENSRALKKVLRELFNARRAICVVSTRKANRKANTYVRVQFHAFLEEEPSVEAMLKAAELIEQFDFIENDQENEEQIF